MSHKMGTGLFLPGELAEESSGRSGLMAHRFPLELVEIDMTVAIDSHSFARKKALLLLESPAPFEGDSAAAVDDTMPGKAFLLGGSVEDPDDLAGGPVVPGEGGNLSVGDYFSAGDRLDYALHAFLELHARTLTKILAPMESSVNAGTRPHHQPIGDSTFFSK